MGDPSWRLEMDGKELKMRVYSILAIRECRSWSTVFNVSRANVDNFSTRAICAHYDFASSCTYKLYDALLNTVRLLQQRDHYWHSIFIRTHSIHARTYSIKASTKRSVSSVIIQMQSSFLLVWIAPFYFCNPVLRFTPWIFRRAHKGNLNFCDGYNIIIIWNKE